MLQLIEFWRYASGLKGLKRKGWKKLGLKRVESVADHSFALALVSLFEAERRGYDTEAVLKLALIHDLEEAITGDFTPSDKQIRGASRVRRERELAIQKILQTLPARSRASYRRLWMDLRLQSTKEARLVHQLDRFEMGLQAAAYAKEVGRKRTADFYESAVRETSDEFLRRELKRAVWVLG